MPAPKFSSDPVQQAELLAQWHFENRLLGINPYRDEPTDDYPDDEPDWDEGDWDSEDFDGLA